MPKKPKLTFDGTHYKPKTLHKSAPIDKTSVEESINALKTITDEYWVSLLAYFLQLFRQGNAFETGQKDSLKVKIEGNPTMHAVDCLIKGASIFTTILTKMTEISYSCALNEGNYYLTFTFPYLTSWDNRRNFIEKIQKFSNLNLSNVEKLALLKNGAINIPENSDHPEMRFNQLANDTLYDNESYFSIKNFFIVNGTRYLIENITKEKAIEILNKKSNEALHLMLSTLFPLLNKNRILYPKNSLNSFYLPMTDFLNSRQLRSRLLHSVALFCPILLGRTDVKYDVRKYNEMYCLSFVFPPSVSREVVVSYAQNLLRVADYFKKIKNSQVLEMLQSGDDIIISNQSGNTHVSVEESSHDDSYNDTHIDLVPNTSSNQIQADLKDDVFDPTTINPENTVMDQDNSQPLEPLFQVEINDGEGLLHQDQKIFNFDHVITKGLLKNGKFSQSKKRTHDEFDSSPDFEEMFRMKK
ncbi:MAG: hypothetical protein A3F12_06975 [Gammaproteobacteria bacterium RIFCSPHIGHO2_12_FULL_38_14]|nr:MAG: hypothetical protein A3F12_06975 [Gammaproteobacteria bacterium RIFCSPHIGHO2_12_FULL_38_14]